MITGAVDPGFAIVMEQVNDPGFAIPMKAANDPMAAFIEGTEFVNKGSAQLCPHPKGTVEYNDWNKGYSWMCEVLK